MTREESQFLSFFVLLFRYFCLVFLMGIKNYSKKTAAHSCACRNYFADWCCFYFRARTVGEDSGLNSTKTRFGPKLKDSRTLYECGVLEPRVRVPGVVRACSAMRQSLAPRRGEERTTHLSLSGTVERG